MIQRRSFRWDLVYGVALAVILTVAVAIAWLQGEGGSTQTSPSEIPVVYPAEKCD